MTVFDETRHVNYSVTDKQRSAIGHIVAGLNDRETGEKVGVTRQTISNWRRRDADFIAALNHRRSAMWESQSDALRALAESAVAVLRKSLNEDSSVAAAVHVLRATGMYGTVPAPSGSEDAEEVRFSLECAEEERLERRATEDDLKAQRRLNRLLNRTLEGL